MSKQKKILIVEDEKPLAEVLQTKLKKEGFDVLWEKDGADGLNVAVRERPDCILLDIIMPVMGGVTMLKKLRENNWGKTVPVIMLTNLSDADQIEECKKYDAGDYLIKSDKKLSQVVAKIKEKIGE